MHLIPFAKPMSLAETRELPDNSGGLGYFPAAIAHYSDRKVLFLWAAPASCGVLLWNLVTELSNLNKFPILRLYLMMYTFSYGQLIIANANRSTILGQIIKGLPLKWKWRSGYELPS